MPGSYLIYHNGHFTIHNYWTLTLSEQRNNNETDLIIVDESIEGTILNIQNEFYIVGESIEGTNLEYPK